VHGCVRNINRETWRHMEQEEARRLRVMPLSSV
jgi:hypothetical protein